MHVAKRIGSVLATAVVTALPGAIAIQTTVAAPLWYNAVSALLGALGVGIVAFTLGLLVLLAARERQNQGLKAAIVATAVVGLFSSWSVIHGMQRTFP